MVTTGREDHRAQSARHEAVREVRQQTEEEFQTLAAELSRRLEQMAVEAEKNEGGEA